ncbi:TetR/AcrR family transcriptional regulator [Fontibacillus sp. BL9]|uniref:TetR/AcrR family transcriptional regulator n=1 Tax=Fontibacillus sp. BL9 TaxID=3389971 RepID=UPI00397D5C7F
MSVKSGDKRTLILRTAMQLFAAKGSSATSMQEIAETCGMSKGSLYLHFKSKEELEFSLFDYCYQLLQEHLLHAENQPDLNPRERLIRQFEVLLDLVLELREFLMMQFRDWIKNGSLYREPEVIRENNAKLHHYCKKAIEATYGENIAPYTADLIMLVNGILGAYIRLLFDPAILIGTHRMAVYMVDLLDGAAERMINRQPEPLINEEVLKHWGADSTCLKKPERHPLLAIRELKELLEKRVPSSELRQQGLESLQLMEEEILELRPRRAIFAGMMANVKAIPELEDRMEELERLLRPYLNHS